MVSQIKELLPAGLEPAVLRLWSCLRPVTRLIFSGRKRYCPLCDSSTRIFLSYDTSTRKRKDVICPICLSHERHRQAWIFLKSCPDLNDGSFKRLLHLAPELEFTRRLKAIPRVEYVSADLESPQAMVKMDITSMPWTEASFDAVFCSHVLEHVPDDRAAMAEMFRILKPGGWALIVVPVSKDDTREDPTIMDPVERERLFWWSDHVRLYGLDIRERLAASGFEVETIFTRQFVEPKDCERMRIYEDDPLFFCRKPTDTVNQEITHAREA
jgi:SAM-dependent methyltransferase